MDRICWTCFALLNVVLVALSGICLWYGLMHRDLAVGVPVLIFGRELLDVWQTMWRRTLR